MDQVNIEKKCGEHNHGRKCDLGLPHVLWLVIAEYLSIKDRVAVTSTCREAFILLAGLRMLGRVRMLDGMSKWLKRSKIQVGENIVIPNAHEDWISCLCFSRSGKLFVGGINGEISVW